MSPTVLSKNHSPHYDDRENPNRFFLVGLRSYLLIDDLVLAQQTIYSSKVGNSFQLYLIQFST